MGKSSSFCMYWFVLFRHYGFMPLPLTQIIFTFEIYHFEFSVFLKLILNFCNIIFFLDDYIHTYVLNKVHGRWGWYTISYHCMDGLNHYPANDWGEPSFPKFDLQYFYLNYAKWNKQNKLFDYHNINTQFLTQSLSWNSWQYRLKMCQYLVSS